MFNVGDNIVYPMHGAGTIDAIEEKEILGEKHQYYVIKMPGEVKIMVPTAKAESMGVRSVIDGQSLIFKQKEKGSLSTGEKKMLNNAKLILVSELVLAEHASKDEIEKLVDNKIDMSYKEFRVPTEAKIDLQQSAVNKFIPFNGTTNF